MCFQKGSTDEGYKIGKMILIGLTKIYFFSCLKQTWPMTSPDFKFALNILSAGLDKLKTISTSMIECYHQFDLSSIHLQFNYIFGLSLNAASCIKLYQFMLISVLCI